MNEYEISEERIMSMYLESGSVRDLINKVDGILKPCEKETAAQKKHRARRMVEEAVINYYMRPTSKQSEVD